jgi:hypothetical protein
LKELVNDKARTKNGIAFHPGTRSRKVAGGHIQDIGLDLPRQPSIADCAPGD